ncbi:MAG: metallophosphoesterase family protein [Peptostreptococcaceae bacterium]|nr:metallophosphoesterase family protein [Peptostreptococcaceae bacterium]
MDSTKRLEKTMSRIAIISDIHSNLPALEAVLCDIQKQDIDRIYNLGDIIGKGPSPAECIDLCKRYCDKSILGNWEDFFLQYDVDKGPIHYYRKNIPEEQVEFLRSLGYLIEFYLSGHLVRLFHAHPNDVYCRVFRRSELSVYSEMFDVPATFFTVFPDRRTDIAIYGDIHFPYSIYFDEEHYKKYYEAHKGSYISYHDLCIAEQEAIERTCGRWLINAGSVGQPFDGTMASYLILEGEMFSTKKGAFSYSIRKVVYDNRYAADLALASDMSDKEEYAQEILTGVFRGLSKE